jgi:hypothetical protein
MVGNQTLTLSESLSMKADTRENIQKQAPILPYKLQPSFALHNTRGI